MINNLKKIREIYGSTQEQVATAINVSRLTIVNWESGNSIPSSGNMEKLSMYYGITPDYFYQNELDDKAYQLIAETSRKARTIFEESHGRRVKEDEFHKAFESITFKKAMDTYVFSMRMLLTTAELADIDKLKTASLINKRLGARLDSIIAQREHEDQNNEPSLFDLIAEIEKDSEQTL